MKKVLKKLSASLLGLSVAFVINTKAADGQEVTDFTYQSKGLSCNIDKFGNIRSLKTPKTIILDRALIHASPVITSGEKYDSRIFQDRKCSSLKVKDNGENKYSVEIKGELGNKKYKHIADYTTKISFTPDKISLEYEIVTKKAVSFKSYNPFYSLEYAPCASLKNLGYVIINSKDKKQFCQFPPTYTKDNALRQLDVKNLRIIVPDGHVIFDTGEKTTISMSDSRSWGSKNFRIDVKPSYPYSAKPVYFPAGSIFKWTYSISYENK